MCDSRKWRRTVFPVCLLVFGLVLAFSFWKESVTCMGVRVLAENAQTAYTEYVYQDLSGCLMHNGEEAAVDVDTSTIYISQDIREDTKLWDLDGVLETTRTEYQLYFLSDARFDNLAAATEEGHAFKLIITDGTPAYMQYDVVFTSLPVIRMDGEFSYVDEEGRDVLSGALCLWTPNDPDLGRYSVKTSSAQWHVRGRTSAGLAKKPWKISLKNQEGDNQNMAFLGLGEDDDWILNSMGFDDTRLREKLFMDLWNEMAAQTAYNYPMSSGEYAEVVINGQYSGLYLLQRRIDAKYLELKPEDMLLKTTIYQAATTQEAYEIVYSPASEEYTYQQIEGIYTGKDYSIVNVENLLDINLFLQFAEAQDNYSIKNMYHVLEATSTGYQHYFIPWDTDMSFGLTWSDSKGFVYDYSFTVNALNHRRETEGVHAIHSDLFERMAMRWFDLRKTFLTQDHVFAYIDQYQAKLMGSGAYSRDKLRWGEYYNGVDTSEGLRGFVAERLLRLDDHYAQYST